MVENKIFQALADPSRRAIFNMMGTKLVDLLAKAA